MKSKIFSLIFICVFVAWPENLEAPTESTDSSHRIAVHEGLDLTPEQMLIAGQVEDRLREYKFSDEFILGVLVNAYAESHFDQTLIGRAGERGIFQLHPQGLGKGMKLKDMLGIDSSVDRIVRAVMKNDRMLKLIESGGSAEEHVRVFCEEIERPKNKREKADQRVWLLQKIADEDKFCDGNVRSQLCV